MAICCRKVHVYVKDVNNDYRVILDTQRWTTTTKVTAVAVSPAEVLMSAKMVLKKNMFN